MWISYRPREIITEIYRQLQVTSTKPTEYQSFKRIPINPLHFQITVLEQYTLIDLTSPRNIVSKLSLTESLKTCPIVNPSRIILTKQLTVSTKHKTPPVQTKQQAKNIRTDGLHLLQYPPIANLRSWWSSNLTNIWSVQRKQVWNCCCFRQSPKLKN
jgi:hypothetical protein